MIYLVLLASGNSKRYGSNKLLADYNGSPLWTYGFEVLKKASLEFGAKLYVVSRYSEILTVAGEYGVQSIDSEKGISYSIKSAINAIGEIKDEDKILFLAGDQPNIVFDTIYKILKTDLVKNITEKGFVASCTINGTETGNPVLFAGFLAKDLLGLTGDKGGKSILKGLEDRICKIPCNPIELIDIDEPIN